MSARWLTGDVLAFDLETTGPDPDTARIVTACAVQCGRGGKVVMGKWLVNPGVEIPQGAIDVHSITNEMAATGMPLSTACVEIANVLLGAWEHGIPVVAMNANFDITVLMNNLALVPLDRLEPKDIGPILDPRVIDLACDKYRAGKRKLPDLARHYGVKLGAEHDAEGDALTAARVVWAQARRYPLLAEKTLAEMQTFQAAAYREWAEHLTGYYASQGKAEVVDPHWPLRIFKPAAQESA